MISIVYAIVALSILILVHEFGHFLVARLTNVKVLAFSLGFGKKLLHFTKGETEYAISAVPLGGYVKLLGESPDEEISEEDKERSFSNKTPFQRFLIVFAGPLFNIIFATVIIYFALIIAGSGSLSSKVGIVEKGYPAYEAGVRAGDIITEVNGTKITEWQELLREMTFAKSAPMNFVLQRDGNNYEIMITPKEIEEKSDLGNVVKRKKIGIGSTEMVLKKESVFSAVPKSINVTYTMIKTMVRGIYHMIAGDISTKEIGGPIAIVQLTGKQAQGGLWSLVTFVAFISINLGILNLLPIPVLDGGHILFNFIEIVTRRKISEKVVAFAQKIGLTLLVMLMAFAFYNDIMRLFQTKAFLDYLPGFLKSFSGK